MTAQREALKVKRTSRRRRELARAESGNIADLLLPAAARLFWKRGYTAASTRELSSLMGIQKASLYYHMKSKEGLLNELCVESLRRIDARARAAVEAEVDSTEQLRALIHAHVTTMLIDQEMHATMLTELRSLSTKHRTEVVRLRDLYEQLVCSVLAACQESGALRRDISARVLGLCLLNLLNWTVFWFKPSKGLTSDVLAETFIKVFLEGVLERERLREV